LRVDRAGARFAHKLRRSALESRLHRRNVRLALLTFYKSGDTRISRSLSRLWLRRRRYRVEHSLWTGTVEKLSSGRPIEFEAPLLDPIRSGLEDHVDHTETTRPRTGPEVVRSAGVARSGRYKKVCLGREKCRPEKWILTAIPQFRLRCSAMVAITKRGSP